MTNSKHSLSTQKKYCVSVSPTFLYEKTPQSACGRIAKTCKIARHGYVNCVRANSLTVFDTDILVDALGVALVQNTTHRMFVTDLQQIGFTLVTDPRHKGHAAWMKWAAWWPIVGVWHEPGNRGQTFTRLRANMRNRAQECL